MAEDVSESDVREWIRKETERVEQYITKGHAPPMEDEERDDEDRAKLVVLRPYEARLVLRSIEYAERRIKALEDALTPFALRVSDGDSLSLDSTGGIVVPGTPGSRMAVPDAYVLTVTAGLCRQARRVLDTKEDPRA